MTTFSRLTQCNFNKKIKEVGRLAELDEIQEKSLYWNTKNSS